MMARADISPSHFASTHCSLSSPPQKRSRLSLRRTTQVLHKPCYKEEEDAIKPEVVCTEIKKEDEPDQDTAPVMIDLTQDENTSPNCNGDTKSEPIPEAMPEDENKYKAWTLGLPNCGNTCYINSILQVLRYTPDFLSCLHSLLLAQHQLSKIACGEDETKELIFFKHMHMLFSAMKRKEALMRINVDKDYCAFLMKPVKSVINSLREVSKLFEEGEQHDAHELLITTISAFATAYQTVKNVFSNNEEDIIVKNEPSPPLSSDSASPLSPCEGSPSTSQTWSAKRRKVKSISFDSSVISNLNLGFEGKIRHIVQCLECEKRLEREEEFANLEGNLPEVDPDSDSVNLAECLSQTTFLSGENKFFCEDCLRYNEAKMSSVVVALPPILLIHFSWLKEASNVEKTSIKVIIPRSFQTSDNTEVFCSTPNETYKLFAVVLHIGQSREGGHYVSFIKDASIERSEETQNSEQKNKKFRSAPFTMEPEQCCITEEIVNFKTINATTKWLLFDDDAVSPVCIDEDSDTFPYFNYLSITASPCMIFYHKT